MHACLRVIPPDCAIRLFTRTTEFRRDIAQICAISYVHAAHAKSREPFCPGNQSSIPMKNRHGCGGEERPAILSNTKGSGIMVPGFVEEHGGYLRPTDEELERVKEDYCIHQQHDGYWSTVPSRRVIG